MIDTCIASSRCHLLPSDKVHWLLDGGGRATRPPEYWYTPPRGFVLVIPHAPCGFGVVDSGHAVRYTAGRWEKKHVTM